MKKISLLLVTTFVATVCFAQSASKIVLVKGQKLQLQIETKSSTLMSMMGQTMENNSNFSNTFELVVDDIADNIYKLTSTLTKSKISIDVMGETMDYDSEKPNKSNELAKGMDEELKVPKPVSMDDQGKVVSKPKPTTENVEDLSPALKDMGGNLSHAFLVISPSVKVGDVFETTHNESENGSTTTIKYTVKAIDGDIANLSFTGKSKSDFTSERQGMEVRTIMNGNISGKCALNIKTGIIVSSETKSKVKGNISVMEQEMPIETESTTKVIVTEVK